MKLRAEYEPERFRSGRKGSGPGVKKGAAMREISGCGPVLAIVAVIGLAVAPRPVAADPAPEAIATGQKLAETYCADCHVVALTPKPAWNDPPPFQAIANRPDVTAASLAAHIRKPHGKVATNARPPAEAEELAAYILSLRRN
jgi:cytochrome c